MPSFDLNVDVLDTVCLFLTDYPDLLSLSLTSSAIRPIAIRNILRNQPVVLKNVDIIRKFHDFVFSDAAARLPHIIALKTTIAYKETHPEGSERAIDCLLAILKHAPSLMALELHSSAYERELGYLEDPRLAAAVGELASLRDLTISCRPKAVDFIAAVRSPLKTLVIRFAHPAGGTEWSPATLSSAALSVVMASLENLSIIDSPIRLVPAGVRPESLPSFAGTQFHALRSLTLRSPAGVLHLPLLLDLFPNLSGTLHLPGYPDAEDGPADWSPYDAFKATRERNGRAQEQRSWKRLERLVCRAETLFVLNLRSEIGALTVDGCRADPDRRRYLVEPLRANPPTRLNVQIAFGLGDEPERPMVGIIPPEAAAVLTHLTLCVVYRYDAPSECPPVPWADLWRDTLLPGLADLRALTHLRLVFHCDAWIDFKSELGPLDGEAAEDDAFLDAVRPASFASFAFAFAARALADALPRLRYCFLATSGRVTEVVESDGPDTVAERWRASWAWRIAAGGGLVELQDDVAESVIEREGLALSTEEQEAMHWL